MTIGPVLLSDFDQKEVSLSANFAPLARNPKSPGPKLTELPQVLSAFFNKIGFFVG